MPSSSRLTTSAGGHHATTLKRPIGGGNLKPTVGNFGAAAARPPPHKAGCATGARDRFIECHWQPFMILGSACRYRARSRPYGVSASHKVVARSGAVSLIFERRFEWGKGVRRGFGIPCFAGAVTPPKTEMCLLEGRGFTKMLLENSGLYGFQFRSNGCYHVCNFATHSGKTMRPSAANHSFNCALERREVILNPSRGRQRISENHKGDTRIRIVRLY